MDLHPPQGAHTSHLRTLSKIMSLRVFVQPAPEDLSSKGAAYHTSNSATVNTLARTFVTRRGVVFEPEVFAAEVVIDRAAKGRAS